jgi:hypothetical protein
MDKENRESLERVGKKSKERLRDSERRAWIAEAITYASIEVLKTTILQGEEKISKEQQKEYMYQMDAKMEKWVSYMQKEDWLQLELVLSYYYDKRYNIEE